uniref:ATP-dependent RNA helicase n=1 Tax=Haemonchus placei TaxID=6290 RepID=A0A158QRX3_HAEPC
LIYQLEQIQAGRELLSHHDVVVESPTGSGKTLAYLLPLFTILEKKGAFRKHEFGAVILSPSRELSIQIASVAAPFAAKLDYSIIVTVGGTKVEQNMKKLKNGGNILVATPGRLFQLLSLDKDGSLKRALKTVEILVIDEADRFNEPQFEMHLKEILLALPKQRRTGLFSATQAKELEDLSMFGLRNKKVIKIKESSNLVSPSTLNNFYTVCEAAEKLICTIEFIRNKPDKKVLVFFPSCGGVKYFHSILSRVLTKRR